MKRSVQGKGHGGDLFEQLAELSRQLQKVGGQLQALGMTVGEMLRQQSQNSGSGSVRPPRVAHSDNPPPPPRKR